MPVTEANKEINFQCSPLKVAFEKQAVTLLPPPGARKQFLRGFFLLKIMENTWIEITEITPLPKQANEFLVRNDWQGGTLKLVSWNPIHKHFQSKGEPLVGIIGTHFFLIGK